VCDDELEHTTNFLFGFAGYEYRRVTEDFLTEIKASVNAGKPAIAYLTHNFRETFINRVTPELKDKRLDALCREIAGWYGYTHDLAWGIIALSEWAKPGSQYYISAAEMAQLVLMKIKSNDAEALALVKQALEAY
jgi:hypothetical protein